LYFFVGFFALSLLNRYNLLYFYVYPIFLLVFLIFSSFINSKYKYIFAIIFAFVYIANLTGAIREKRNLEVEFAQNHNILGRLFSRSQVKFTISRNKISATLFSPLTNLLMSQDMLWNTVNAFIINRRLRFPEKTSYLYHRGAGKTTLIFLPSGGLKT